VHNRLYLLRKVLPGSRSVWAEHAVRTASIMGIDRDRMDIDREGRMGIMGTGLGLGVRVEHVA
jgi:hypothetical protein